VGAMVSVTTSGLRFRRCQLLVAQRLDAGNLAIFYSKGRNNAEGDLFYTQVKYLRRAKNGPKGLVIPTQEKNLHIKLDENRLRKLESCRIISTP